MSPATTRILIADDDALMRGLLASILRQSGYQRIAQASDGSNALNLLRAPDSSFDLAFLDIAMPGLTGIQVMVDARALRPELFCVIVSAHSAMENVLAALNAGARGFVVKPFNTGKIMDIMKKYESEAAA